MALTDDQKAAIRSWLGYTARFGQFDTEVERGMSALDNSASDLALVITWLGQLDRIDAAIVAAEKRFKADKVGSIELNEKELDKLSRRGLTYVGRIARSLGVEVRGNPFGGPGGSYQATARGPSAGGNAQRHG